jgi:hypothetical protein
MKNIVSITAVLIAALLISSCRDEDEIRMPNLLPGANMRIVVDVEKGYLNFEDLANASYEFDAYSVNNNLQKVEFLGTYIDVSEGDTIPNRVVLTLNPADFANGKARGVIRPEQIASAFTIPGGVSGLGAGDLLNLKTVVTLTDGRTFSADNSSLSITNGPNSSFTAFLNTFIGCPSEIRTGTYKTVASGTSTDPAPSPNPTVDFPGTVTITRTSPTSYSVSDVTGGMYYAWYGVYDAPQNIPGTLIDVCGNLSLSAPGPFGEVLEGTTTISPEGVITFEWSNFYGDTGVTVFTPQ